MIGSFFFNRYFLAILGKCNCGAELGKLNSLTTWFAAGFIRRSGVFDRSYYQGEYFSGQAPKNIDLLQHFLINGVWEGKNPNPFFDTSFYISSNPDVLKKKVNPLLHYLLHGAREGRNPHPLFDTAYYQANNPEISKYGINPLAHFLARGNRQKQSPSPRFDVDTYLEHHAESALSGLSPFEHYIRNDYRKGLPSDIVSNPQKENEFLNSGRLFFPPRVTALAEELSGNNKPVALIITHNWGGGVEKNVKDLMQRERGRRLFLVLRPFKVSNIQALLLAWPDPARPVEIKLAADDPIWIAHILRALGVDYIHIHSLVEFPVQLDKLIKYLNIPFDFTVHDYFTICPKIHMAGEQNVYCGEGGAPQCRLCLKEAGNPQATDIHQWRASYAWLFRQGERIICPSLDVERRIRRYYPDAPAVVLPHVEMQQVPIPRVTRSIQIRMGEEIKVAILGRLDGNKGAFFINECLAHVQAFHLPIDFQLIGYLAVPEMNQYQGLKQTGPYEDSELNSLIDSCDPHLIFFPNRVPETYSYTLTAALRSGRPVLVPDLGAFPERIAGQPNCWVYPWPASAGEVVNRIGSIFCDQTQTSFAATETSHSR